MTMIDFNQIKGFICDMDGVIYYGNELLPGVREFIDWLYREDKAFLFLTNSSAKTKRLVFKTSKISSRLISFGDCVMTLAPFIE